MRMKEIGNPPGRIALRRRGRESIVQGRVVIYGLFEPEAEPHWGFGQNRYGTFPIGERLSRFSTSFLGQSRAHLATARRPAIRYDTLRCGRACDVRDVPEVPIWFLSIVACGMGG